MEVSCLQLGFYLASWGMFRSGLLRTRSAKQFRPVVELVAETPKEFWDIDVHCYDDVACEQLVEKSREISHALSEPMENARYPTRTVATKVMLGVFGNVPAYDRYVRKGLSQQIGASVFGVRSLKAISRFYQANAGDIDNCRPQTLDFGSGQVTSRLYTRAKLIDMIFYVEGGAPRPAAA